MDYGSYNIPVSAFFVEGIIKSIVFGNTLSWTTFSSSTLSMSVGLLCLFVSQSLLTHNPTIPSEEENERLTGIAHLFSSLAILSFILFGIIVLLSAFTSVFTEVETIKTINSIKSTFNTLVLVGAILPIISSLLAQRSFKLSTVT